MRVSMSVMQANAWFFDREPVPHDCMCAPLPLLARVWSHRDIRLQYGVSPERSCYVLSGMSLARSGSPDGSG